MRYRVIKPFRDFDGSFRLAGEAAELDDDRAAKLRSLGLIGGVASEPPAVNVATAEARPEKATKGKPAPKGKPPVETATRRPSENTALR